MRNPVYLVLVLAAAGCTQSSPASMQDAGDSPAAAPPAAPVAASGQPVPEPSHAPGMASTPSPAAKLALDSEGLRIFTVPAGTSRPIAFGLGKTETLAMLATVQGAPPSSQRQNIDCGATNAVWPGGLTVWFARDKFVGWSLGQKADSSLATVGGLRVGSTRIEVENGASVGEIVPSSLGEEFTAGGVGGLLASADADARVSNLWAGAVCIAR